MAVETDLWLNPGGKSGAVVGNVFSLRRTVTNIPSGVTISSGKLTIKTNLSDAIGAAIIALTATVENSGSSGTGIIRFDFSAANTNAATAGTLYYFDIQVTMSDSSILTLENGQTHFDAAVTTL